MKADRQTVEMAETLASTLEKGDRASPTIDFVAREAALTLRLYVKVLDVMGRLEATHEHSRRATGG